MSTSSYSTVAKWIAEFKNSTQAVEDAPRNGRTTTPVTDERIRAVEEVMMRVIDQFLFVGRIADELSISKISSYEIMSNYLEMKTVSTRWMPKLFTPLQCANRVDCCEELLENYSQDLTGFFGRIVTRDETWMHHYDPLSLQEAKV